MNDLEENQENKNEILPDNFDDDNSEIKSENELGNQDEDEGNEIKLEEIIAERDELKDKLMRALAESENIRKRALKDRQDAEIYAVSKMSRDILSVFDNLQRALDLAENVLDEKSLPMIEGLELTKKDLLETFKRNKIEQIEPMPGDKFDPKLHQAMLESPSQEVEKGHIINVISAGFLIGDRLLRASNVSVSSGSNNEEIKNESKKN